MTDCQFAEPDHLPVAPGRLILVADQMQRAVCHQEGDLVREPPAASPGLPGGLRRAHDDVAEPQDAVRVRDEVARRPGSPGAPRQPLAEREDVRRPVDPAVAAVEPALRRVVDEGERDLGLARQPDRSERGADGGTERRQRARGSPGDRDPQDAAGRMRVMRSSGYGMRSW